MTWRETKLKYLARIPITNGLGESGQPGQECWPRYIRTTDIATSNSLNPEKRVTLPPDVAAQALVERDDLLLCAAGSLGKTYLHESDEEACYAGYLVRFRADPTLVHPRFVSYWSQSQPFSHQIRVGAVRSTIDNFSAGKYQNMSIVVPPLEEQRQIVDFLDDQVSRLDSAVRLCRQQDSLLSEWLDAQFLSNLRDVASVRPDGLDQPKGAQDWLPLSRILAQLTNGYVGPTRDLLVEDGVPYLQSLHIKNGNIDFTRHPYYVPKAWLQSRTRIQLRLGDVLIVQTGALGESALVGHEFVGASCHALLIARVDRSIMTPEFLWHTLQSGWGRELLLREKTGALHPHLEAGKIRDVRLPAPPLRKQDSIVNRLDLARKEVEKGRRSISRQLSLLEERKQALITAAVTGQFDVTTARVVA